MKIIKTLNLPTENRNIYTVKIRKNVFAEVMEITDKNIIYVIAVTDRNGDLISDEINEKDVVDFVKNNINVPNNE